MVGTSILGSWNGHWMEKDADLPCERCWNIWKVLKYVETYGDIDLFLDHVPNDIHVNKGDFPRLP